MTASGVDGPVGQTAQYPLNMPDPLMLQQIIDRLEMSATNAPPQGTPLAPGPANTFPTTMTRPQLTAVDHRISALDGREIYPRVNTNPSVMQAATPASLQGIDERHFPVSPPIQQIDQQDRLVTLANSAIAQDPTNLHAPTASEPTAAERASRPRPARPSKWGPRMDLERIIDGTGYPDSMEEARAAQEARYVRLYAKLPEHEKEAPEWHGTHTSASGNYLPDIFPEFFRVENFEIGKEKDTVRCACSIIFYNPDEDWISCDTCFVWQHMTCMKLGLPKDLENGKYYCHICDPFAHRVRIAAVRRGQPLSTF